jgi:DNA-binding response OmpR family regulator
MCFKYFKKSGWFKEPSNSTIRPNAMSNANPISVLVVDDEPGLREVMAIELEMNGYHVLTAPNGRAAFDLVQSNPVQTIISDVRMPDGDGLELLQRVQERSKETGEQVRVILMTGFSGISRDEARARGAVEMLLKPFLIEELLAVIGNKEN